MNGTEIYDAAEITRRVSEGLLHAATHVEDALVKYLHLALAEEKHALGKIKGRSDAQEEKAGWKIEASIHVLQMILENLEVADRTALPLCQDTGMVVGTIEMGPSCILGMHAIEAAINAGIENAVTTGYFRRSVVADPLYDRINTGTNLPAIFHWRTMEKGELVVSLMLKGFGSENCGGVVMLAPTAGEEGVVEAVVDIVRKAGGKPCPPIVLGVGIGGTMDQAAVLSKQALFRNVGVHHADPRYAALERRIKEKTQRLGIGAGGFGGTITALSVAIEAVPTHIAGLPVAVSISCWADRKTILVFGGSHGV